MLPKPRSPNRDKAYDIYKEHGGNIELRRIAERLAISEKTISGWKCKDKWDQQLNGVLQTDERSTPKTSKRNKGAPKGNKNAVGNAGGSAPEGNVNAIKHGAYQNIYTQFLPEDERDLIENMPSDTDLENEIQLLRYKIANLSQHGTTFFYDMFGNRHEKEVSEEEKIEGILACTKQLEKLVKTQEQNRLQREKLELEKAKGKEGANESELADQLRGLVDELND